VHKAIRSGLFLGVAAVAAATGFYLNSAYQPAEPPSNAAGALTRVPLTDLEGKLQRLDQWKGQILVVNFWATWCVPCREEIPALMKIQKKYGNKSVKIVGIALDNVDKVREYAAKMNIDYVLLIGGMDILSAMKEAGNQAGVLPYSLVLDRTGRAVHAHAGALTESALDTMIAPLI
jgi:thiol-disulfide isomerase/thioredoxin